MPYIGRLRIAHEGTAGAAIVADRDVRIAVWESYKPDSVRRPVMIAHDESRVDHGGTAMLNGAIDDIYRLPCSRRIGDDTIEFERIQKLGIRAIKCRIADGDRLYDATLIASSTHCAAGLASDRLDLAHR